MYCCRGPFIYPLFLCESSDILSNAEMYFKMLTGYDCPSCGSQRVLHMLLHGDVVDAFSLNPFIFIVAPYLLAVVYSYASKSRFSIWLKPYISHYITISVYLAIYILWWVVRNTEWWKNQV